jgi:hypothetical protein
MCSERKIQANIQNALKSTGPRTAQGKAKVSQNAVTHGLTSKRPVLDIEDTEEFRQFTTELVDCLGPTNPLEAFFAERAACLAWRVQRAQSYETLILNHLIQSAQNPDSFQIENRTSSVENPQSLLGQIITDDFRNHRTLEKISRYEARLESSMLKCFKQFEKLRQNRKTNPINVGQASPLGIKYDKTNPNNVGQASVLDSKLALTPKESSSNGNQNNEFVKTKPNYNPIMIQDGIRQLKIPA